MKAKISLSLLVALILAGCGGSSSSSSSSSRSAGTSSAATSSSGTTSAGTSAAPPSPSLASLGPEGVLLERGSTLAPASSTNPGSIVDGIQCAPVEQLVYHVHAHLQVFVDGQPKALPAGIGIPEPVSQQTPEGPFVGSGKCFYWMHTHTTDGIIHIESPTATIYSLGTFFDIWGEKLGSHQVAGATGNVTAYLNGKLWTKDPRAIPLQSHSVIQLDVGKPAVPYGKVSFGTTGL
jgi:hypothetical protein